MPHKARAERFPASVESKRFARAFFPEASVAEWSDWRWQLRRRVKSMHDLTRIFLLSDDEREAVSRHRGSLPVGITPYYASLMNREDSMDPLRAHAHSRRHRIPEDAGEADDPLGEDHDAAVPGLVHRYPDRVLFLATGFCSTYCRYCTRSRMVGEAGGDYEFSVRQWDKAIEYISQHTEIRDVLLSGGDPLTLSDEKLDYLLGRLRAIKHVEFLRIGTKVPVVLPMRITRNLTKVLRKTSSAVDEHPLHAPARADAGSDRVDGAFGGCRHSPRQPVRCS